MLLKSVSLLRKNIYWKPYLTWKKFLHYYLSNIFTGSAQSNYDTIKISLTWLTVPGSEGKRPVFFVCDPADKSIKKTDMGENITSFVGSSKFN